MTFPSFNPTYTTPGAVTEAQLVSAWDAQLLDLVDPEVRYNMFKDSMVSFLEMFMTTKPVAHTSVQNLEKEAPLYQVRVGAATASGAGASVWVTIKADSMFESGKFMLPAKGYHVQLPPLGNQSAEVIDVDPTVGALRIQLRPLSSAHTITLADNAILQVVPAAMVNSGSCTVFSNARRGIGEQFNAVLSTVIKHRVINGEELASFTKEMFKFGLTDSYGNPMEAWWHEDLSTLYEEFEMARYRWKALGQVVTNTGVQGRGLTGLLNAIIAGSLSHEYSAVDGLTSEDFDSICAKFIAERHGCRDFSWWNGWNLRNNIDKLVDDMSFGRVNWAAFEGMEDKFVNFGFSGINKNDFNFYFHLESNFTRPDYLGATGWNWTDNAVLLPLAQTVKDGSPTTFYQNLYLAGNGYSRELEMRDFGKLKNGSYQGACDNHTWEVSATIGGRMFFRKAFMLVKKGA